MTTNPHITQLSLALTHPEKSGAKEREVLMRSLLCCVCKYLVKVKRHVSFKCFVCVDVDTRAAV